MRRGFRFPLAKRRHVVVDKTRCKRQRRGWDERTGAINIFHRAAWKVCSKASRRGSTAATTLLIKRCTGETYYYSENTTLLNCVSQLGRSRGGVLFLEAIQTRRLSIVFPSSDLRGSSRASTFLSLSLSSYTWGEMRKFAARRVTSATVFSPVAQARVHRHSKEREGERRASFVVDFSAERKKLGLLVPRPLCASKREVSGFRGGRPAIRKLGTRPDRRRARYSARRRGRAN